MKSKHKVIKFDYSKYESEKYKSSHDIYEEYEFWGFHKKSGRLHIDTKRYKKACESVGIKDFMPTGLFDQRDTPYYEPSKVTKYDYKVNLFSTQVCLSWRMKLKALRPSKFLLGSFWRTS